jgi:peptidoglycan hydrolase-like protein with peptidoglycan-binding domain
MYLRTKVARRAPGTPRSVQLFLGQLPTGSLTDFSPAEEKALRITDAFENTSWYAKHKTLSFRGLTGDFDGCGLSFGLLQWNIGTGSLQPLLQDIAHEYPQLFKQIFGPDAEQMQQLLGQSRDQQLKWARSINDYSNRNNPRVREPWAGYFQQLGDAPEFQRIQLRHVRPRMDTAGRYARRFGLVTERGLALMFDVVTQQGEHWLGRRRDALIRQRCSELKQQLRRDLNERERLEIIVNVIAQTVKPRWSNEVRVRKMAIVDGRGTVHGRPFDLEHEFGLTDQPWSGAAIGRSAAAPIDLDRAVRLNRGYAQSLGWQPEFDRIVALLGFTNYTPDERNFAETVARWQQSRGLPVDGVVGPTTWSVMRAALGAVRTPTRPTVDSRAPSVPAVGGPCVVSRDGSSVRCGSCEARERRIRASAPARLVDVPKELLADTSRRIQLDGEALAAYQRLYEEARASGIPRPFLKISSGHRDYDRQAGLWRERLLGVFATLGCASGSQSCLAAAIDATSQALRSLAVPHPRGAWGSRFRQELQRLNCSLPCDPLQAVEILRKGTAPPGGSPHHTGRAVDVYVGRAPGAASSASTKSEHVDWQRRQPSYQWLVCNAARFGFYPYNAEPWHWEYNPPR